MRQFEVFVLLFSSFPFPFCMPILPRLFFYSQIHTKLSHVGAAIQLTCFLFPSFFNLFERLCSVLKVSEEVWLVNAGERGILSEACPPHLPGLTI